MSDLPDWDAKYSRILRAIALVGAAIATAVLAGVQLFFIYSTGMTPWQDLVRDHFAATLGLSGAGIIAFAIVVFLRQTEGPIELEALGMKFKGAAGQVVLWAFLLIVYSLCVKLLW